MEHRSHLLHVVALCWYGSLLPAGTECCSQLASSVALSWYESLSSVGTDRCSQLARIVALTGTAHRFHLERSLAPNWYRALLSNNIVALSRYGSLLSADTKRCSQLVRVIDSSWNGVLLPAGAECCSQLVPIVALSWYGSLLMKLF